MDSLGQRALLPCSSACSRAPRCLPITPGLLWTRRHISAYPAEQSSTQDFCGPRSASAHACLKAALAVTSCGVSNARSPTGVERGRGPAPQSARSLASITVRSPRPRAYPNRITLVDDVITRGSSFVGMVPRIQEVFPSTTVRCFALIRTISPGDIDAIFAPTAGTITYRDGLLMRQP